MKFHSESDESLEPCKHMEMMLNRTADGTAPPAMKWYAKSHAARCPRCGGFLRRITLLLNGLRGMKSGELSEPTADRLSQEQWETVEASWSEVER